jgi:hypothetical protein
VGCSPLPDSASICDPDDIVLRQHEARTATSCWRGEGILRKRVSSARTLGLFHSDSQSTVDRSVIDPATSSRDFNAALATERNAAQRLSFQDRN